MDKKQIKAIETTSAPHPVGPYSQGILAGGWLYCSGQIALNPSNGELEVNGDIEEETRQVLNNLFAVLKASGCNASNVVKTTIFLIDLKDFTKVNKIYSEFFNNDIPPARACVEVSSLPKGVSIEIDCVAWIG